MQQRQLQKKYSKVKVFFLVSFLILISLGFLVIISTLFVIEKIEIISDKKINAFLGSELIKGKNILTLNTKGLQQNLLDLNPNIDNLNIKKIYPNKIQIYYKLIEPLAFIKANDGFLYISDSSKILKKDKKFDNKTNLTEILYYQKFDFITNSVGSYIDYVDIRYSLNILKKVNEYGYKVVSIDISRPNMIRLNLGDSVVIFTAEKNINDQIDKLEKIIKQFKVEGNSFSLLDLRFDKPILRFK